MAGVISFAGKVRKTLMRLPMPGLRERMTRAAITKALQPPVKALQSDRTLLPEELEDAKNEMEGRRSLDPKIAIEYIKRNIRAKDAALVLIDPAPEIIPPLALRFRQLCVVENSYPMRAVTMKMLFNLGMNYINCVSQFPENGRYQAIYIGKPQKDGNTDVKQARPVNTCGVRLLNVPSGALFIFRRLPGDMFAPMTNNGFSLVDPSSTGELDKAELCTLKYTTRT